MNCEFTASSGLTRSILAIAAVVTTLLIVGSIEGLSRHYSAVTELASAKAITVADRSR